MAKIVVFSEIQNAKPKNVTLEILGKLQDHQVDVVVVGAVDDSAKKVLSEYGANNIFVLQGEGTTSYSPEGYAHALEKFLSDADYSYCFAGATSLGKDLFPRLAGMFDAGMCSEVVEMSFEGDTFKGVRPLFAGKCLSTVTIQGPKPHFVTVRPNALGMPSEKKSGVGNCSEMAADVGTVRAKIQEIIEGVSGKVDLTEANIIVSGGRAMKDKENFKILEELADVIGATVGASRAAVDSGFAEYSMQVGQTGKTVSPSLYIACGISGAIQHLAGMRTSKVIVAVNSDPDAPIFSKADYGIVGDLFQVVPILTREFKKLLS